jgi:hypothetical protein
LSLHVVAVLCWPLVAAADKKELTTVAGTCAFYGFTGKLPS